MTTYLITGTSRGLGLSLASTLASAPVGLVSTIFATARKLSPALRDLIDASKGRVVFVELDVTKVDDAYTAAGEVEKELGEGSLDVLINNAGLSNPSPGGIDKMDDLDFHFSTNVTSAHNVTRAFLPLLRKGKTKKIINISTSVGCISLASSFMHLPTPGYKVSKAALNMLNFQYAEYLKPEKFKVVAISPGWLRTDFGSEYADLPVEVGARSVLEIIDRVTEEDTGKLLDILVPEYEPKPNSANIYGGGVLPW